jgi:hypothetical protein
MASINDGLRPVIRTFTSASEPLVGPMPGYVVTKRQRVIKVDGVSLTVWGVVIRKRRFSRAEERARKAAAETCRRARDFVWRTTVGEGAAESPTEMTELLWKARRSALMLTEGFV